MLIEFFKSPVPVFYDEAISKMRDRVAAIVDGSKRQLIWFLEHPPIYTAGAMASDSDLLDNSRFPVYKADRGGKYTYHGPGQRVVYLMLNLSVIHNNNPDIRLFINQIEQWLIMSLKEVGITAEADRENVGIWVQYLGIRRKIASVGIRIKKWVTYHGIAININPILEHFSGIIPCGLEDALVTSVQEIKPSIDINKFDAILLDKFVTCFSASLEEINEIC